MKREDEAITITARRTLENIAAEVPLELADADALLAQYGRWAVSFSRGGKMHTLERQFVPEQDRFARYALERRREEAYGKATKEVMMRAPDAELVQACIGRLLQHERWVIQALYVPKRIPASAQLQLLKITPQHSRVLHISGLKRFTRFARECRLLEA